MNFMKDIEKNVNKACTKEIIDMCWTYGVIGNRIVKLQQYGFSLAYRETVWGKECMGSGCHRIYSDGSFEILDGGGLVTPRFNRKLSLRYATKYFFERKQQ